ncbi:unnamed protein product [Lactuca virosa]|uniref:Uncharacterized protein n=1 Tax=Lactuca virosa TaxID=75947 RepID=A0AAU9N5C3_9ASTR|nr:unnamed protein product [Lactuca virosa]
MLPINKNPPVQNQIGVEFSTPAQETCYHSLGGRIQEAQKFAGIPTLWSLHIDTKHILKTKFSTYQKGDIFWSTLFDLLGDGIFNVDADEWKFQRQLSSDEFNTNSLRHFVENVVDDELNKCLIPILTTAAANDTVLDLQDILQRFALDNICRIAFGYDPAYLTPLLPKAKFAVASNRLLLSLSQGFLCAFPSPPLMSFSKASLDNQHHRWRSQYFPTSLPSHEGVNTRLTATAPGIGDSPDHGVEEEIVQAAIEASKQDSQMSQRQLEDPDLAQAVSLSLKTVEQAKALRQLRSEVGPSEPRGSEFELEEVVGVQSYS